MNTRVAWVLLFTYVVQLVLGGFGIWMGVLISGKDVQNPPTPPTTTTAPPTTLPPSGRFWTRQRESYHEPSEEYKDYVKATGHYASQNENPALYLVIPCGVAAIIAAVLVVGGICSRKTFATTAGLYSSLGLWIVIFLIALQYQSVDWNLDEFLANYGLVIGMQVGWLLLLASQIALAMWELRRQKTSWPCINPTHLFTVEIIFLITRVTLGVCVISSLSYFEMISGLRTGYNYWESPYVRFPDYYVLPCIIAALYGVIVSSEGILSQLFGKVHNRLIGCTTFISAICYAALAVVVSPVFVRAVIGPYRVRQEPMVFASISSIVSFLHAIACLAFPRGVRTPPPFIRKIANHLLSMEFSSNDFNYFREALSSSSAAMSSAALTMRSKFRGYNTLYCNIISSVLSFLAIILVSIGASSYSGTSWPGILMLCGDVAVFFRSMPEAVTELVYHNFHHTNLLKSLQLGLENIIIFTASIGVFVISRPVTQVVSGVINLVIVIVQTHRVMHYYAGQNKSMTTDGETGGEDDTKPLKEAELETAQELSDDEHSGPPEILA